MKEIDDEHHVSDGAMSGLTAEQKAARREIIKRSAKKMAAAKTRERYLKQKIYSKNEIDRREIEELIELGLSPATAMRLAARCYRRGTFHDLEDCWWLLR